MMLRRSLSAVSLVLLAAAPLSAQMSGAKSHDPDIKAGGGALPAGWMGRTDRASAKIEDAKFVTMGPGFHVTSGPAAIYWRGANTTTGPFTATVTFTQTKKPAHPEAYGIFFFGTNLRDANQSYAYFLVRGDGKVTLKHRAGSEVHTLLDWTDAAAVRKEDADGKATNTLTVNASRPDSVRLLVNGAEVIAFPASQFGSTNGVVGLRVNHNLDVHIAGFSVTPAK